MKKMSVFDLYMEFPSPCGDKLQCCRLSVCPVCGKFPSPYGDGTNITTVDSRSDHDSIVRRKKCLVCNHRWSTIEIDKDQWYSALQIKEERKRGRPKDD